MATEFPIRADTRGAERDIDRLIAKLMQAGKAAGMSEQELKEMEAAARKAGTEGSKSMNQVNKSLGDMNAIGEKLGAMFLGLFAVDRIVAFGKAVFSVTAEFQRMEAVLANTLGSQSAAATSMKQIQEFAAKTPFSVKELTENFIKLANRGVKPSIDQLRAMGDLAATLGKPFEQLVEALLDINNPERWKEIGVRASTAGEKVTLSFRGVNVEVDRTVKGVTEAAVKLGELQGVSGSMAVISETLGGKMSNLNDSWDTYLNTLGRGNSGIMATAIDLLNQMVQSATMAARSVDDIKNDVNLAFASQGLEDFKQRTAGKDPEDVYREMQLEIQEIDRRVDEARQKQRETESIESKNFYSNLARSLNLQAGLLENYVMDLEKTADAERRAAEEKRKAERARKIKEDAKAQAKLNEELDKYVKYLIKIGILEDPSKTGRSGFISKPIDELRATVGEPVPAGTIGGVAPPGSEGLLDALDQREEEKREILLQTFQFSAQLITTLDVLQNQKHSEEMRRLQERYDYELKLAGNNEDAKDELRKKFDKEKRTLERKQAEDERNFNIFRIIIETARAITAALPNLPLSILAGVIGGAQLLTVRNTQLPRFAEGVFNLDGPGTSKSDSIPALLSRGESVVPAAQSLRFKEIIEPIINDKYFTYDDISHIIDTRLPTGEMRLVPRPARTDDPRLLAELQEIRNTIRNKREVRLHFDENGFRQYIGRGYDWTRYIATRYSM